MYFDICTVIDDNDGELKQKELNIDGDQI